MDVGYELFHGDAGIGQDVAIVIGHQVALDVVDKHIEVAHVEGLEHHAVEVGRAAGHGLDALLGELANQIEDAGQQEGANDDVDGGGGRLLGDALRMEPLVNDGLYVTMLLQS